MRRAIFRTSCHDGRYHPFSGEGLSTRIPRQSTWSEGYGSQTLVASSSLPHGDGEVSGFYGPLFRGKSQSVRSKLERTLLCRDITVVLLYIYEMETKFMFQRARALWNFFVTRFYFIPSYNRLSPPYFVESLDIYYQRLMWCSLKKIDWKRYKSD